MTLDAFKTNGSSPPEHVCACGQLATTVVSSWPMCDRCISEPDTQQKPTSDFQLIRQSTIFLLEPLTDTARAWVEKHLPADRTTFGAAVVVEHRYISDIFDAIVDAGLAVEG
jgi:hypothetical protein